MFFAGFRFCCLLTVGSLPSLQGALTGWGFFSLVPGSFRRFSAGVILGEFIPQTCGSSSTLFISQLEVTLLVLGYVLGLCSLAHSVVFVFALSTLIFFDVMVSLSGTQVIFLFSGKWVAATIASAS